VVKVICSRQSLLVGYYAAPIIEFFLVVFAPVAYPIGKGFDLVLGDDFFTYYSREEFLELMNIQLDSDGSIYSLEEKEYLK
jgi:CBS domain containing-hemolysin-like protein